MISNATKPIDDGSPSLCHVVADTISRLLACVPEPDLQKCICEDLTTLLLDLNDLNGLAESDLVVEFDLFELTRTRDTELLLSVSVGPETQILEAVVLKILLHLSREAMSASLTSLDDLTLVFNQDMLPISRQFWTSDVFLSSLSDILMRSRIKLRHAKSLALLLQSQIAASEFLEALLKEWRCVGCVPLSKLSFVASSVCRACAFHLQHSSDDYLQHWDHLYSCQLAILLAAVVESDLGDYVLPGADANRAICISARDSLFESISHISPSSRSILSIAVIRSMHVSLTDQDVFPSAVLLKLVSLLEDPVLNYGVVFFLAKFISRAILEDHPTDLDIEDEGLYPKRSRPVGSSSERKRQKVTHPLADDAPPSDGECCIYSTDLTPPSCWITQLSHFFSRAEKASTYLQTNRENIENVTDHDSLVSCVASAIRLLVLSNRPLPPTMIGAVNALDSDAKTAETLSPLMNLRLCVNLVLGLDTEVSKVLETLNVQSGAFAEGSGVRVDSLDPVFASHLAIHSKSPVLSVGGGILLFVAPRRASHPLVHRIDLLLPINDDDESQRQRLLAMNTHSRRIPPRSGGLVQETIDLLTTVEKNHRDDVLRLLRWQSVLWLVLCSDSTTLRQVAFDELHWMVKTAFADPSQLVRDYTSHYIGLLLEKSQCAGFLLTDEESWQRLNEGSTSVPLRAFTATKIFKEIDRMLHEYCSVPQSQLSFTVGSSSITRRKEERSQGKLETTIVSHRRAAMRALASFCHYGYQSPTVPACMVEETLKRIVGLWSGPDSIHRLDSIGLGFSELSLISRYVDFEAFFRRGSATTFLPILFRDALLMTSPAQGGGSSCSIAFIHASQRERLYHLLAHFIHRFCGKASHDVCLVDWEISGVLRFLELCLPTVLSQFVVVKDYQAMLVTTGFKLFALAQKRAFERPRRRESTPEPTVDPPVAVDLITDSKVSCYRGRTMKVRSWDSDLEGHTRRLCLAPVFIERILPCIFMNGGRSEMTFFVCTVLQKKITLETILTQREQLLLKGLLWEAGKSERCAEAGARAIRAAAVARTKKEADLSGTSGDRSKPDQDDQDSYTVASEWVSSQFMYLLVNVVQSRWASRSTEERMHSMRCLMIMLQFLKPSDSPPFMPQIMATVNASIESCESELVSSPSGLRLLAVKTLHLFLRLIASHNWETLGQNLTGIVVSLIPLLPEDFCNDAMALLDETKLSIALLEWLTEGELGRLLAPFFTNVPFLPSSSALDVVRSSLRKNGVDVDSLQVATTQGTQHDSICRDSLTSDGISSSSDRVDVKRQVALGKRLSMLCSLLTSESANVRRVALKHLSGLLRANRGLFHELVLNENTSSITRFVTVARKGSGSFGHPDSAHTLAFLSLTHLYYQWQQGVQSQS